MLLMTASTALTIGFTRNFSFGIPFWTIAEHGARYAARESGAILAMRHCIDDSEMAASIQSLIQQQVHAIIIAPMDPTYPAFLAALEQATAAGIPLIVVDAPIPYPVRCLVRSDDLRGSADGAAYLAERLGYQGKVIHLQGERGAPVAQLRSAGVHQVLDTYTDIEIIDTDQGKWSRRLTQSVMRALLAKHHDIRGVIAANDPMALGAMDALAEAGQLERVAIIGVDGDPDALIAIETGLMAGTIQRSPYQMGRTAIETAITLIRGDEVPAEILLGDMRLVTAENVARAAIEALYITPGVINDLMESSATLAAERSVLRTIIDSLPDVIYVKDREGRFEVANVALAQLLGVASPDALIGKTDLELFPRELATQYDADDRRIIASGVPLIDKEEPVQHADGTSHWVVTTKVPLRDPQGRTVGLVGRGQDITERRRAETERQQLQEQLIQAQALALQELSTPLIPISEAVLVMPLIGRIDSRRASQILETLLSGIQEQQAELAIIDITGVSVVDTQVAHALLQAARAVKLLGAQVILTGLRPEVAQALVSLGVDLSDIVTHSTLQNGVAFGLRQR
jgi:PAS domain S-box-containing protein